MNLKNQKLFEHLQDEHGLTLLESELHEIILKVQADDDIHKLWNLVDKLREEEGNSVEIVCDNPDFDGPNNMIYVSGYRAAKWQRCPFHGESLLECLEKAVEAMS